MSTVGIVAAAWFGVSVVVAPLIGKALAKAGARYPEVDR